MNDRIFQILEYIPPPMREEIASAASGLHNVEEIRLRADLPISIFSNGKSHQIDGGVTAAADIQSIFTAVCEHSVYAYLEEIKQGFITVNGGHRVGICGRAIVRNGEIENIKDISGLNFRIAREVIGCADKIFGEIISANQEVESTLIISPPQCGKTTMLRDLARQCSNFGLNVSVVDCRGEIAACYRGVAQNDLGANVDVLDGAPKAAGMMMLLRSMSPQVLVTDEIGGDDDIFAVSQGMSGGVAVIASVHGAEVDHVLRNEKYAPLFGKCGFSNIVSLSRRNGAGTIEEVRKL